MWLGVKWDRGWSVSYSLKEAAGAGGGDVYWNNGAERS